VVALREIEENFVTPQILDQKPEQETDALEELAMPEDAGAVPQMPAG